MLKVVLDANMFVSAILKPNSKPAKILELVQKQKVHLLVSMSILLEIRRVLLYPKLQKLHHLNAKQIDTLLEELIKFAVFIKEELKINAIKDDPSDNKYLECAVQGEAEYIISGDHHLKDLKNFKGIKIIDADRFLRILAK